MNTSKALTSFLNENIVNDFDYFLFYKDKQLLKEEKYIEFAEEQLKKIRYVFLSIAFGVFYGFYYISTGFIEYGQSQEVIDLVLPCIAFGFMIIAVFIATKKYYTIKSSMNLLIRLLNEDDA